MVVKWFQDQILMCSLTTKLQVELNNNKTSLLQIKPQVIKIVKSTRKYKELLELEQTPLVGPYKLVVDVICLPNLFIKEPVYPKNV